MNPSGVDVVVAGHICLDVIPSFEDAPRSLGEVFAPGRLVEVGKAMVSTGGAVSNTGLALHRLGVRTRMMGKVGDDLWGRAILDILQSHDSKLVEGMIVDPKAATSYTVVLSPPGYDRIFLHAPGANDTFSPEDVPLKKVEEASVFHFGYPPLMARMYEDGGASLEALLRRVKEMGVVTSVDMAMPDPGARSGRADWREILPRVLPHIDVFLPSVEEMLLMIRPEMFEALSAAAGEDGGFTSHLTGEIVSSLAEELLGWGATVVGLKAGDQGLYLRTASRDRIAKAFPSTVSSAASPRWDDERKEDERVNSPLRVDVERWADRELWTPCFEVNVSGTTGSGDATVAGFLAALVQGEGPEETMAFAAAVGACSVEAADATSGVPSKEAVHRRIKEGWRKRALEVRLDGWTHRGQNGIWMSMRDSSQSPLL